MADDDEARYGGLAPEVVAIARRRADEDRDLLARLILEGKARREYRQTSDGRLERVVRPEGSASRAFVRDVDARVESLRRPKVNVAIRPKKRKR